MTARSAVANLERDVAALRRQRAAAAAANRAARGEAAAAARAKGARSAMQGWQLGVVRRQHERLVQPEPIQEEWRLRNLEQTIKVRAVLRAVLAAT